MAITQGTQTPPKISRPYVYRGTGEDQFPETVPPPKPPKPKGLTVSDYRDRQRQEERAREVARMKREAKRRREERWAAEVHAFNRTHGRFKPEAAPVFLDDLDVEQAAREPEPVPVRYRPAARPAPGWRPMTGDDLAALLEET